MSGALPDSCIVKAKLIGSVEEASRHRAQWRDLVAQASEANICYTPWMLLPAWAHLGEKGVVLWVGEGEGGRWDAVVPLVPRREGGRGPVMWETWVHAHAFLGTPLVRAGEERAFWATLGQWLEEEGGLLSTFKGVQVSLDGPVANAWKTHLQETARPAFVSGRWQRATLTQGRTAEAYLDEVVSAKKRKNLAKQEKKLQEAGPLQFDRWKEGEAVAPWVDAFLTMEHGGWKGREGTSLRSQPAAEAFFRAMADEGAKEGGLWLQRLRAGETTVAMTCDLLVGGVGFAFKVAYDEAFRQCSPGYMLEINNIRTFLEEKPALWMDSCAAPDHPVVNDLWLSRREIGVLYMGQKGWVGHGLMRVRAWAIQRKQAKKAALQQEAAKGTSEISN